MRRLLVVPVAFLMMISGIVVLLSCGGGGGGGDNGAPATYYFDGDGDGYGDPARSGVFNSPQDGWVLDNTDCDDGNFDVHPGAVEICGDGIDNNCNGLIDCYDVTACAGDGACAACVDGDGDGYFAIAEQCSGGDDCDDTDANVNPGGTGAFGCPSPCSACKDDVDCGTGSRCIPLDGQRVCGEDCYVTGTCPEGYTCADQDNGERLCVPKSGSCTCLAENEWEERPCERTNQFGTCSGFETCDPEEGWVECTAFTQAEICDGLDNNCDGQVDEGFDELGGVCSVGLGECLRWGVGVCLSDGTSTMCDAEPGMPGIEICDGLDNDCDGQVDEGFDGLGGVCSVGKGECLRWGVGVCLSEGTGTMCDAKPGEPGLEICDGKDNDCNGVVDEIFVGLGNVCYAGVGECLRAGVFVCRSDGTGTMCDAEPGAPGIEICDGKDNDCDGQVDEDLLRPLCEKQEGVCAGSTKTCGGANGWNQCGSDDYGPDYEPEETRCDGLDNDCDGEIDEGCPPV